MSRCPILKQFRSRIRRRDWPTPPFGASAPEATAEDANRSSEFGADSLSSKVYGALATLKRKASSRLSRHVPLARRRLVNDVPMVSFTFDDAPASAGLIGAQGLEEAGGRGTYYIASGLIGREDRGRALVDRLAIRELHLRGHEIGLHGHAHRPAGSFSAQGFHDDLRKNREWLEAIDEGIRPTNFAYPYGLVAFARKRQLYRLVSSSRSIAPGVMAGNFDPQFLRCVELADERLTPETLGVYLDAAVKAHGWLIFCAHEITEQPTGWGCTPALFRRALDGAALRGVKIVTVAEGLRHTRAVTQRALPRSEIT